MHDITKLLVPFPNFDMDAFSRHLFRNFLDFLFSVVDEVTELLEDVVDCLATAEAAPDLALATKWFVGGFDLLKWNPWFNGGKPKFILTTYLSTYFINVRKYLFGNSY